MVKVIIHNNNAVIVDCRKKEIEYTIKENGKDERPMTKEEIREFLISVL